MNTNGSLNNTINNLHFLLVSMCKYLQKSKLPKLCQGLSLLCGITIIILLQKMQRTWDTSNYNEFAHAVFTL